MKTKEPPKTVSVTYLGVPCLLGRFGSVVTGQELNLTEQEWNYAQGKGDTDFVLISEKKSKVAEVAETPVEEVPPVDEDKETSKARSRSRK